MKVLVTGSRGFIGRNLVLWLKEAGFEVLGVDLDNPGDLERYALETDFIVHLAGVNRPEREEDYMAGNLDPLRELTDILERNKKKAPVLLASSSQAALDNPYGRAKKAAEDHLFAYSEKTGTPVYVYRFDNVYGKWCRPHYNSVVATFIDAAMKDEPLPIDDPLAARKFVYIDDVCEEIVKVAGRRRRRGSRRILTVRPAPRVSIGRIAALISSFRGSRKTLGVPRLDDPFERKLYATYLSYLPDNDFAYTLVSHADERGSFTEFLRSERAGQISVNYVRPGVTKGGHWHHTKAEKFLVLTGACELSLRRIGSDGIIRYRLDGSRLTPVDIPPGYTHSLRNVGKDTAVVLMWASEPYDPERPDTYREEVEKDGK